MTRDQAAAVLRSLVRDGYMAQAVRLGGHGWTIEVKGMATTDPSPPAEAIARSRAADAEAAKGAT